MEKTTENEMETGLYSGLQGLGFPRIRGTFLRRPRAGHSVKTPGIVEYLQAPGPITARYPSGTLLPFLFEGLLIKTNSRKRVPLLFRVYWGT